MTTIYGLQDVVVRRITEAATDAKIITKPQIDIKSLDVSTSVSKVQGEAFSVLEMLFSPLFMTFDEPFDDTRE